MRDGKLQIGLVGCGGIANNKHLPALSKMKELCEIIGFCDIIEERAAKAAKEYGTEDAKVYTDYNVGCLEKVRKEIHHWLSESFPP